MKIKKLHIKKILVIFSLVIFLATSFSNYIPSPFSPHPVYAEATTCAASGAVGSGVARRVGGVSLDQAATFLANMSDYTGAYYDAAQDRIVFIGTTNTNAPQFDKDDLVVAFRSLFINHTVPQLSLEWKDGSDPEASTMQNVKYYGGIEDTNFGQKMLDADYRLKQYTIGFDSNGNEIQSTVSGYKSVARRYLDYYTATPSAGTDHISRYWISPQYVSLKKDDTTNSFVFDQVKMQVQVDHLIADNDDAFSRASRDFVAEQTADYDQYAAVDPAYYKVKELAKLVAIVKWLQDNGTTGDLSWIQNYQTTFHATPREVPIIYTPWIIENGWMWKTSGGIDYTTPNTYNTDDGTASSLQNASQQASSQGDVQWTFTKNGQQYQSVAIPASTFRKLGAYATSATDISIPVSSDLSLSLQRAYSSFTTEQRGIGRGWEMRPARIIDLDPTNKIFCNNNYYSARIGIELQDGTWETFTYTNCNGGYQPDDPGFHIKITAETGGFYTAILPNQTKLFFDSTTDHTLYKIQDKHGNSITNDPGTTVSYWRDNFGHRLKYTFNSQNLLTSVSDWTGRQVTYTYDTQGNLATVIDAKGNITTYAYDTNNRLISITDRLNQNLVQNTYDQQGRLLTQKDPSNVTTTFTYDDTNNKIIAIDSLGRTETTFFDSKSRITEQDDAGGNTQKYTYGNEFNPETIKDKDGNITSYNYDGNGNIISVTYPTGKQITYQYDGTNNLTKSLDQRYSTANPKETDYVYDANGNLTQETIANTTIVKYTYDSNGNVLTVTDPRNKVTGYTRGEFGTIATEVNPQQKTTNYWYDNLGRLTKEQDPDGKAINYTYDNNNNVLTKTGDSGTIAYAYDAENKPLNETLPDNSVTQYGYNAANSITSVTNAANNVTSYGYDQYQNMTSKQDALNRTTQYQYDQLNRQKQVTSPLGKVTKWEYDPNGNITKRIDANNNTVTYTYNTLNELTKITYPDLSTVTFTYDDRGNLLTAVNAIGTTTYTYDQFDRLTNVTDPNNNVLSYQYDDANNITKIIYPNNKQVTYTYNDNNEIQTVTDWNGTQTTYAYDNNGTLLSKTLPNGITTQYVYDGVNKITDIQHKKGSQVLAEYTYQRDSLGDIKVASESSSFPSITPTPTSIPSQSYSMYTDSLQNGWDDWSWGSTNNFSDTMHPQLGSNDISWVTNSGYAALYLHKSGGVDTTGYSTLNFALQASQTGQSVQVQLYDANGNTLGSPVSLSSYGGDPVTGSYKSYAIPLANLSGTNKVVTGFIIQDITGTAKPAMYVDSVSLQGATQLTNTPTPTPSSTNTTYVYDDSLASGWQDWSWSSTNNFATTTFPQSGTKHINWIANSGYAGFYLHGNFDTTGQASLTFALKATQANEPVQVQLYDNTGTVIGSPLQLTNYGGNPVTGSYKIYTIPLPDLGGANQQIGGILIQDISGAATTGMYVDSVGFISQAASFTPTPTPTGSLITNSLNIYSDALSTGWEDWSWSSTNNFSATTAPYEGTKHISWDISAPNGGFYLHNNAGIDTTNYASLSFALQSTQASQAAEIQLYDNTGTAIGAGVNLSNYGGNPSTGSYKVYTIPLSDLGGVNTVIKGFNIHDATGVDQPAMYIDSIKLNEKLGITTTGTDQFTYDILGQLTSAIYPNHSFSYSYDKVGNRLTNTKDSSNSSLNYNNENQLTSKDSWNFIYDNNGNQTKRADKVLTYDLENRLTAFDATGSAKTEFVYDALGNRIAKKVNGTTQIQYVNDVNEGLAHVLVAKNIPNSTDNYYLYGAGIISQGATDGSSRQYYLEDGIGNTRFVTDSNGNLVKSYSYDADGNLLNGNATDDFLFKGEQLDPTTGLTYMRARYYDPTTGRFISKDPFSGAIMNPQTQNGYNYANNDPVNLSDPSGLIAGGISLNFNLGVGVFGTGSISLVGTSCKEIGLVFSFGWGGTTGVASGFGVGPTFSPNANSLNDLKGQSIFAGASGEVGGGDISWDKSNPSNLSYSGGISLGPDFTPPGVPGEGHGGTANSLVIPIFHF